MDHIVAINLNKLQMRRRHLTSSDPVAIWLLHTSVLECCYRAEVLDQKSGKWTEGTTALIHHPERSPEK